MRRVLVTTFFLLLAAVVRPAVGQSHVISGRITDRTNGEPIVGATVVIGRTSMLTGNSGEFRVNNIPPGEVRFIVEALGYVRHAAVLLVRADTSLAVALDVNPVLLDSLRVTTRYINVRGYVKERALDRAVYDAFVFGTRNRNGRTRLDGSFEFKRIPAGVPFEIDILAFAFLPVRIAVVADRDTTISLLLDADTMIQRLIDAQSQKLQARADRVVGKAYAIPRERLLREPEGNLRETMARVLMYAPVSARQPIRCVIIDEQVASLAHADHLWPEEVERVEVLYDGSMIRVYTRRYMAQLITADPKLDQPGFSEVPAGFMGRSANASTSCA